MATFLGVLTMIFLVILGGIPTIFLTLSVPVMIGYKLYRKIHYGISMMK